MPETPPRPQGESRLSPTGHPLPRRTSPGNSVTLLHHKAAREASSRNQASFKADGGAAASSPRRNSSGDSHQTAKSDPTRWFEHSNQNPTAPFSNAMDVDPPFFQKESDSSNDDSKPYPYPHPSNLSVPPKLAAQSSSADDYRSVIDDLTVEIQRLKEELKRYKQKGGPGLLRKEKLFEIKIHGLPKRKRTELENTLRKFTDDLENSPNDPASAQRKKSKHATRDHMYSGSGSKHASSSSGSNARPVDSAYASMSTGANSSGTSLGRPSMSSRVKSSDLKVENYLREIPEGLYPRHMALTEKDKKKLVVRRLEQLFTGKISGRQVRTQPPLSSPKAGLTPVDGQDQNGQAMVHQPPPLAGQSLADVGEPSREARIAPEHAGQNSKNGISREEGSGSNSNGDPTESGGNGNSSGSGTNPSPTEGDPPEQRPTRPKDLDPDRVQVPSENMEYIRHLGLIPPELLVESQKPIDDVHPDQDGWVYLNLLCNLAQLHIINVTPDFVRSAVADWSTKFQLSPDGRKIRWRGGSEGTKFSSDSSGNNSQRSPETEDDDTAQKDSRKRQRGQLSGFRDFQSGTVSSNDRSKFGAISSDDTFHYKPMFVHQESSTTQTSTDETMSSLGPIEDSNVEDSRWGFSGSGGTSSRRKRRHDGAIIYYSGAPFCTDLSGDPGDVSPATHMVSSGQTQYMAPTRIDSTPQLTRSSSGADTLARPLSDRILTTDIGNKMDIDSDDNNPGLASDRDDDDDTDLDWDMPWSEEEQVPQFHRLEPCGLGGVLPEDHFVVLVTTKRQKTGYTTSMPTMQRTTSDETTQTQTTDSVVGQLAGMSTTSPGAMSEAMSMSALSVASSAAPESPRRTVARPPIEIDYMAGRIKRLLPIPLPPAAIFIGSTDSSRDYEDDSSDSDSEDESFNQLNPHQSNDYPDGVDLTSGDEDGEDPDDEPDTRRMYDRKNESSERVVPDRQELLSRQLGKFSSGSRLKGMGLGGSSTATAGGLVSGHSNSESD